MPQKGLCLPRRVGLFFDVTVVVGFSEQRPGSRTHMDGEAEGIHERCKLCGVPYRHPLGMATASQQSGEDNDNDAREQPLFPHRLGFSVFLETAASGSEAIRAGALAFIEVESP